MKKENDYLDTCEWCGEIYNYATEGHTHTSECECRNCDPGHDEYDSVNAAPIIAHVKKHGQLCFCCQECECNFVNNS